MSGIVDLQRALRSVDRNLPRQMRVAGNRAAQRVVDAAKGNASSPADVRAAATIRAASQQRNVAVKMGRNNVPFALGREFGADRNRQRRRKGPGHPHTYVGYRQFPNFDRGGRMLWPAIRANRDRVVEDHLQELNELLRSNGFS